MTDHVVFVEPLHDDGNAPAPFVVQPRDEGMPIPLIGAGALDLGESLLRLYRVVDEDVVRTQPC